MSRYGTRYNMHVACKVQSLNSCVGRCVINISKRHPHSNNVISWSATDNLKSSEITAFGASYGARTVT